MMSNKVVIKRNWRGKIVEIELRVDDVEPDRKPVLELISLADSIFAGETKEV